MRTLFVINLVSALIWSSEAFCCFAPKPEQTVPIEKLVQRTGEIYLAEAIEKDQKGKIYFKVIETLKGSKKSTFLLEGVLSSDANGTDFDHHNRKDFWLPSGGRSQIEPSCEIIPTFQHGKKYLIFASKPYHFKSFELIESVDNDEWIKKVKKQLKIAK